MSGMWTQNSPLISGLLTLSREVCLCTCCIPVHRCVYTHTQNTPLSARTYTDQWTYPLPRGNGHRRRGNQALLRGRVTPGLSRQLCGLCSLMVPEHRNPPSGQPGTGKAHSMSSHAHHTPKQSTVPSTQCSRKTPNTQS